jgi:hypothetical protein
MTRLKLRTLDPGAKVRAIDPGARLRIAGDAGPKVKVTAAFYGTAAWKTLVRQIIKERGRRCQDPNCQTPERGARGKIYGDHVVELRDGGAPLDPRNVLLRCPPCHGRKSAAERVARAAREAREARLGRGRPPIGGEGRKRGQGASTDVGSSFESGPYPESFFPTGRR